MVTAPISSSSVLVFRFAVSIRRAGRRDVEPPVGGDRGKVVGIPVGHCRALVPLYRSYSSLRRP
jgi:hypothetical protein